MVQKVSTQQSECALPTSNGGTEPYQIPWPGTNSSHNQPAGPNLAPSHIYHFEALLAQCSTFVGMRTDHSGNRRAFSSPTTDFELMQGEYWTAQMAHQGLFADT
jgi:hypothetical protein